MWTIEQRVLRAILWGRCFLSNNHGQLWASAAMELFFLKLSVERQKSLQILYIWLSMQEDHRICDYKVAWSAGESIGLCIDAMLVCLQDDHGICDYKVVGSAGESFGFYPSQGSNKKPFQSQGLLNQDIDMNIFINTLRIEEHNLVSIPHAPGFTWIRLSKEEVCLNRVWSSLPAFGVAPPRLFTPQSEQLRGSNECLHITIDETCLLHKSPDVDWLSVLSGNIMDWEQV